MNLNRRAGQVQGILVVLVLFISSLTLSAPTLILASSPTSATTAIPAFKHIFIIMMENKEYGKIIGAPSAPYINSLAQQYGLATNFYATTQNGSLLDYLALTGGSTFGLSGSCTDCVIDAPNIVDQLESAGKSWKAYMEDLPSPCFLGRASGLYRKRHNPFIYYKDIQTKPARCQNIVPYTEFATDLQKNTVPNYVWITPNMCHDMHSDVGCRTTDKVKNGDDWLATEVPTILNSSAYRDGGVLFITWDEGATTAGCCEKAAGGHIVTLVISPLGKPAYTSAVAYDHYSLLRTIEDAWDLGYLGDAGCPCTTVMADFFS